MASRRLPFSPLRFCVFLSFLAGEGQRWGGMGEQFRSVANEPELAGRSPLNEESACRGSGGRGVDAVSAHGRSRHLLSPFCVAAVAQDREQLCTLSLTPWASLGIFWTASCSVTHLHPSCGPSHWQALRGVRCPDRPAARDLWRASCCAPSGCPK